MNKNFLIVFFSFFSNFIFAQSTGSAHQDTINRIIDFYTAQIVSYTLEGDALEQFKSNFFDYDKLDINKIKTNLETDEKTLALIEEIQKIKDNKREKFNNADYNDLIVFLSKKIFNDEKYLKAIEFKKNRTNNFETISQKIEDSLKEFIVKIRNISPSVINDYTPPQTDSPRLYNEENESNKKNPDYWIIIIIIIIMIMIIFLLLLDYKRNASIKSLNESYDKIKQNYTTKDNKNNNITFNSNSINNNFNKLNNEIIRLENEIYKLNNKLFVVDLEIKHLKSDNNIDKETNINQNDIIQPILKIADSNKNTSKFILYFSTPNTDGSFLDIHKTEYYDPSSLSKFFKFELDSIDSETANVYIIDDYNVQKYILMNYQTYLGSVCNYSNSIPQNCDKIKTEQPGTAYKEGEKWQIRKKIQIKFE